jgi:membrane fusion protein, multidrug efflux system
MAISEPSKQQLSEPHSEARPLVEGSARPRKRGWLWFLILVALAGGGLYYYRSRLPFESKAASPSAPRGGGGGAAPVSVGVAAALKEDVPYYLSGLGTVTAFNIVTVKSRVDGQLEKVNFKEGQFVQEGDLLAEIDPRPFQVALAQMGGQLARDQAQLKDAHVEYGRYEELRKEGVVAQQQVDVQNSTVGQLEGAVRSDQAMIDNQKLQLEYCKIKAPLSGRVGLRLVDQGNMVRATDPNGLVVIAQLQPISVLFTLPEDSLPEVVQHMNREELTVEAYSRDDQAKLATGKLVTIDNQIDTTTGTVRFKGVFENRDLSLWPNQFVNSRLFLTVRKNAIVVPLAAVQRGAQGPYVYTVRDGQANLQPVKVDLTQGNISLIASGVAAGDVVVVDGQDRLQTGARVETHSDAAGPGGNKSTGGSAGGQSPGSDRASKADGTGTGGRNGGQPSGGPGGKDPAKRGRRPSGNN